MQINKKQGVQLKHQYRMRFTFDGALTGGKSTASSFSDAGIYYVPDYGADMIKLTFPSDWGIKADNHEVVMSVLPFSSISTNAIMVADYIGSNSIRVQRFAGVTNWAKVFLELRVYE